MRKAGRGFAERRKPGETKCVFVHRCEGVLKGRRKDRTCRCGRLEGHRKVTGQWASPTGPPRVVRDSGFKWMATPLHSLRAVTPLRSQLSCLACKTCVLDDHLFQIWALPEWEKPWGQGWKCRMSVHREFRKQPLNGRANKPTNRLWSWRRLPGNLSVKTASHIDFPLQYFLTWPEPSDSELPSVLLSGTCREDRLLNTQAKTAVVWWTALGWSYREAVANPKMTN